MSVGSHLPKLLVMVGGEEAAISRCRQAFDSFGEPVIHLGPVGSGLIAKLINNTLLAATVGIGDDAITLGRQLGLDEDALMATLASASSGGTWAGLLARRRADAGDVSGRTNEWATKDVGLTQALAAEAAIAPDRSVLRLAARGAEVLG